MFAYICIYTDETWGEFTSLGFAARNGVLALSTTPGPIFSPFVDS